MKRIIFLGIAAFIFLPVGQAFAGPQLNPGKWEITTTTQMAGLPAQSAKHTQCLTTDDAVPTSHDPNQSCEISDIKTKGNTITWKVHCTGGGDKINGNGSVTYSGNTMNCFLQDIFPESCKSFFHKIATPFSRKLQN